MKKFLLTSIILILIINCKSQSIDSYLESQNSGSFHKIYLHTDRDFYFKGDTLWFSAYLLDAAEQTFNLDTCNLYLDFHSQEGELIFKEIFLLTNGFAEGFLSFNNKILSEGNYILRAHTDNIKQLGNEYFYRKSIQISEVKSNLNQPDTVTAENRKIYIDFFPEGGFLLDGQISQLAFKAYDENNIPVNVKGRLKIGSTQKVLQFYSEYNGMGRIYFIPDSKEKYKIEIDNFKLAKAKIPEIKERGAKIMVTKINKDDLRFSIVTNLTEEQYYVAFIHRGNGNGYFQVNVGQSGRTIKVLKQNLRPGINRIILLNNQFEPLSERLFFLNSSEEIMNLTVTPSKDEYKTREEINLDLKPASKLGKNELARLSLAVVDKEFFDKGVSQNIHSYLLLDSELKGQLGNTSDYFINTKEISAENKLDLLMLCNGWSNYIWNDRINKEIDSKLQIAGINIHGNVTRNLSKKPLVGTDVILNLSNEIVGALEITQTDEFGNFEFENVDFIDTALVLIQALNHREKSNTSLHVKYAGMDPSPISAKELLDHKGLSRMPLSLYRRKYLNEQKLGEFYPDRNSQIIEEIQVVAKKNEEMDDGHFRLYKSPDHSVKVENNAYYSNIFQFLTGRFPGVRVEGKKVIIRGVSSFYGSSDPLFLIDGIPIDVENIDMISMHDVDKVEVLKGSNTAIYGSRGGNGVISILTKKGGEYSNEIKEIPGTYMNKIKGFQIYREFYSPVYTNENIQSEIPDYRSTLYWNPKIVLGKKETNVSFFSCDNISRYAVIVEGLTTSGKICLGEAFFDVNERR